MKSVLSKIVPLPALVAAAHFVLAPTRCHAAPANDNLANAEVIPSGSSFSVTGTDVGATQEAFEETSSYPLVAVAHTVWYSWTPTVSGFFELASTHSSEKGVFRGATPNTSSYVSYDDGSGGTLHFIHVQAGQQYLISIGNDSSPSSFTLTGTITAGPAFFNRETALSDGVYYLSFSDGTPFGYYNYLSDSRYIYHYDLGFEFVFDAQDGEGGVYLYDFSSKTFFYTSPAFPFPYLYDFTLKTVLYYYPDTSSAGHYTTKPRYFYDFATHAIITK